MDELQVELELTALAWSNECPPAIYDFFRAPRTCWRASGGEKHGAAYADVVRPEPSRISRVWCHRRRIDVRLNALWRRGRGAGGNARSGGGPGRTGGGESPGALALVPPYAHRRAPAGDLLLRRPLRSRGAEGDQPPAARLPLQQGEGDRSEAARPAA